MTILQEDTEQQYDNFLIRRIQVGEEWLTISVVRPSGLTSAGITVYYRGHLRVLGKFLSSDQSKIVKEDLLKFKKEGIHAYGLAKHIVEPEDAVTFLRIINNENQTTNGKKLTRNDKFLLNLARDLIYIGVFGL